MTDDPTPSSAARLSLDETSREPPSTVTRDTEAESRRNVSRDASRHVKRSLRRGLGKKLKFTTQLLTHLDALVFAELSALYYLDCSLWRFCLRTFFHASFLTPKTDSSNPLVPATRAHVLSIFIPNMICIALHIFTSLPTASEESRGYLHGGVMVDFIGQKAPTSKLPLLLLDCIILAVQSLMLAVHLEREKMKRALQARSGRSSSGSAESGGGSAQGSTQDHDAEERGILRDSPDEILDEGDLELRSLSRTHSGSRDETGRTANGVLRGSFSRPAAKIRLPDLVSSGNVILGDYHVIHTLRTAATDYENAAAHTVQTLGYNVTLATLLARRRANASGGPT